MKIPSNYTVERKFRKIGWICSTKVMIIDCQGVIQIMFNHTIFNLGKVFWELCSYLIFPLNKTRFFPKVGIELYNYLIVRLWTKTKQLSFWQSFFSFDVRDTNFSIILNYIPDFQTNLLNFDYTDDRLCEGIRCIGQGARQCFNGDECKLCGGQINKIHINT